MVGFRLRDEVLRSIDVASGGRCWRCVHKCLTYMKNEILESAQKARESEVLGYQVNIDNYALAIAYIDAMPDADRAELDGFRKQLADLLASETHEQKKAKVMLAVIKKQLE